jgi:hypothetical protein
VSDRRFYVSLTATCPERSLSTVLDRMSGMLPQVADAEQGTTALEGLSLSFTASDAPELASELTSGGALPTALPVAGGGGRPPPPPPGTPPADATPPPIVPDPPAEPAGDAYVGQHAEPDPTATSYLDPEPQG